MSNTLTDVLVVAADRIDALASVDTVIACKPLWVS